MTKERRLVRVQLDMTEERVRDIEKIIAKTGISTRKDVFENALALFEWAINEREYGRTIASIDKGEKGFREVLMPALASIKHEANHKNNIQKSKAEKT